MRARKRFGQHFLTDQGVLDQIAGAVAAREGDAVFVPEIEKKHVDKPTDARHEFKRKGDPVKYRLRLMRFGKPRAGVDYVLEAGSRRFEGSTDGDGKLEHYLPGNATSGKLYLDGGSEVYPIRINRLDPPDAVSGAQQRLQNLGFPMRRVSGEMDDATKGALARFQAAQGLPESGDLDGATVAALASAHP